MTESTTPLRFNESGEGWHLKPKRRILFYAAGLLIGAIFLFAAVAAFGDGKPVAGVVMVVIGLALGSLPFGGRRKVRQPPRLYDGGLLLPAKPMSVMTIASLGLIGPILVIGSIGVAVDAFRGDGSVVGSIIGMIIGTLFGLLMCLGAYAGVKQRRAPDRGLLLTPDSLTLRTRAEPVTIPWTDLAGVRAHWTRPIREGWTTPGESINNWISFPTQSGSSRDVLSVMSGTPDPAMDADSLAMDPALALGVLQFYAAHPEARAELGSDQALARVDSLARTEG